MTEFQEFTQDAPNFVSMERGELVAYAYGMFAAVTKVEAENAKLRESLEYANNEWENESMEYLSTQVDNAKLRELVRDMCVWAYIDSDCDLEDRFADRIRELGVEVEA